MNLFGMENEYTVFNKNGEHVSPPFALQDCNGGDDIKSLHMNSFFRKFALARHDHFCSCSGFWLKNGGRMYVDMQSLEYASPECQTVEDLCLAEKAGDIIVKELFSGGPVDPKKIFLMKQTASPLMSLYRTWGAHECYKVTENLFSQLTTATTASKFLLAQHLISRQVYTGCGHLQYLKDGRRLVFWISPRANFLNTLTGSDTRDQRRSIINCRDESHMLGALSGYKRLHLICGDMNRSDWQVYLKIGTTILVLECLERFREEIDRSIIDTDVCMCASEIMKDGSRPFRHRGCRKDFIRLLDQQRRILDFVEKRLASEGRAETRVILRLWHLVLDDVVKEFNGIRTASSKRLDWLIKKNIFEEVAGLPLGELGAVDDKKTINRLLALDFSYRRLNYLDLYSELVKKGVVEEMFGDPRRVGIYARVAPAGRAQTRVWIVDYLNSRGNLGMVRAFDWGRITLGSPIEGAGGDVAIDDSAISVIKLRIDDLCKSSQTSR